MKKILHLIFLLFCILINSQDLNYNLLLEDKGDFYYAKRENLTDVWIKIIGKTVKKKNKQGKTITVKGKEIDELYRCDCEKNLIKLLNSENDSQFIKVTPFSKEQLFIDFTCSNLEYKNIIGENKDLKYYLGNKKRNGNYYDAWIKIVDNDKFKLDSDIFFIRKLRFDCNNKKWSHIIDFFYNEDNTLVEFLDINYNRVLGMRNIEDEDINMIFNAVCFED